MKKIVKVKLFNFKRFDAFEYFALENRNIFIGDNEAGKSTILQAIDIVLSGNRSRVESIGLESLFNKSAIDGFLNGNKGLDTLPKIKIELYLNDHGNMILEGRNNTDNNVCHGLMLNCEPMIEQYGEEIRESLNYDNTLFPYEYYSINFSTFSGQSYTQNRKFINHILIDSSLIGTEYATKKYTKSLYESNTTMTERYQHSHAYRHSKSDFKGSALGNLNNQLDSIKFDIKDDSKSNLENDLIITKNNISVSQMGKGSQCFIKTEFALRQRENNSSLDLILIEEPENHLSHLNMKKLINRIEQAAQNQIIIATHSNSVCSRLDLHNASLLNKTSNRPISLRDLPNDTANYFIKAPNNKILEFVLSERVVLVEGDAEYILLEKMYKNKFSENLEESNIHVISIGGVSFKRYLDLARLLNIRTAVITDNDGDFHKNCIDNYSHYTEDFLKIFSDEDNHIRTTLEKCIYQDNESLCERIFSEGRRTLTVQEYMLKNKADVALKLLEVDDELVLPNYISRALEWIKE